MEKSCIRLGFTCSQPLDGMTPVAGGHFCGQCSKTVRDFSAIPMNELSQQIEADKSNELCGNFRAYQLDQPFGNWKDKLVAAYQRVALSKSRHVWTTRLLLLLVTGALMLSGCHRHRYGRVGPIHKHGKHSQRF